MSRRISLLLLYIYYICSVYGKAVKSGIKVLSHDSLEINGRAGIREGTLTSPSRTLFLHDYQYIIITCFTVAALFILYRCFVCLSSDGVLRMGEKDKGGIEEKQQLLPENDGGDKDINIRVEGDQRTSWHTMPLEEVFKRLESSAEGLR
jgi:hypothetical protein